MKKLIALFTVMAMVSATVFAAPLSLAASLENGVPVKNEAVQNFDLFADVGATQLSDTEAAAVEGDGIVGALVFAAIGAAAGAALGYLAYTSSGHTYTRTTEGAQTASLVGGVSGGIMGAVAGAQYGAQIGAKIGAFLGF
ncbi:hypothetical protein FACS1894142_3850 [Spirochaetia bacterium]|nr:hypothetical protein FACS1894142_3850 [Spirochaetia bacterium]